MGKYLILFALMLSAVTLKAQSYAASTISASVTATVGAEVMENKIENLGADARMGMMNSPEESINTRSHTSPITKENVHKAASFKIIGSDFMYDVSLQNENLILKNNTGSETMQATVFIDKSLSPNYYDQPDTIITVGTSIQSKAMQANGSYSATTHYTFTIAYN